MSKSSKPPATGTAKQFHGREGAVSVCQCKSGCSSKKCKCFKLGLKCTSQCHNGENCANKGMHIHLVIIFFINSRIIIASNEIRLYLFIDLKSGYSNESCCSEGLSQAEG